MKNKTTSSVEGHISPFEKIKHISDQRSEYWSAREFAEVLGYTQYRNFEKVIEKAKLACFNSGHLVEDHFADVSKMVTLGSSAQREVADFLLSRYACYLCIQNSDPSKEIVAVGQTYFATQTRIREIEEAELEEERRVQLRDEIRQHNSKLADAARDAGVVDAKDYATFQNHGYKGLYGGLTAADIHSRKGLKKSQKILDHMGSAELAANYFRATQAEEKLRREHIVGKGAANAAHFQVGAKVRQTIKELGGTMPENLPSVDSVKKLKSKHRKQISSSQEPDQSEPANE